MHKTNFKLTNREESAALILAKGIVILVAIVAYFIRLVFSTLFKLKRTLYKLAIIILLVNSALTALNTVAYAPYANASEFQYTKVPVTEKEQIVNYIYDRFGKDAPDALKVFKCESGLRPDAMNTNWSKTPGVASSYDYGVAQINTVHNVDKSFLLDWHTNIDVAYKIFSEQSWTPWTCKWVLN